ncbi:MAG: hypothetical protein ACUVX8_03180 [Candidatus Zipacnadales bacterium]
MPLFSRDRSIPLQLIHDGEWHEYAERFLVEGTLSGLRIDPSNMSGCVEFDWIRLKNAVGQTVKQWEF